MVKLYYTPTSCGAASFIAALAAQVSLQTEQVDIKEHKTASGANFYEINPKGNVPALVLDDGTVLNENVAVLQYIADLVTSLFPSLFFTSTEANREPTESRKGCWSEWKRRKSCFTKYFGLSCLRSASIHWWIV